MRPVPLDFKLLRTAEAPDPGRREMNRAPAAAAA